MPEERKLGWMKDKFVPEAITCGAVVRAVPDKVDMVADCPAVRNQGGTSSCVGFGVAGVLASVVIKQKKLVDIYSPTWIYNGARYLEGWLNRDCGCYPEDAWKWLTASGCLYEKHWPFTGFTSATPTSDGRGEKAIKYPQWEVIRVVDGIEGIISALADGNLVAIGTPWPEIWFGYKDGILPTITDKDTIAGGHKTFLYGYDKSVNGVFVQNSWGLSWGGDGRGIMPMSAFKVFKQLGGYDAHIVKFITEEPVPPIQQYALNISVSPVGKGAVTGAGVYDVNSFVPIRARAVSQYKFSKWSPSTNIANPNSAETLVKMVADVNTTACFVKKSPICAGVDVVKSKLGKKEVKFTVEEV